MKFREIFRFELAYQARRVSTWVYFVVLFAFGFLIMLAAGADTPEEVAFLNAPNGVAFFTVMGGVIWLLLAGAVAGEAGARDVETRMHPLTYTAPVSKADYLGGRFLAAFVLNASMLLALQVGLLLSSLLLGTMPAGRASRRLLRHRTADCLCRDRNPVCGGRPTRSRDGSLPRERAPPRRLGDRNRDGGALSAAGTRAADRSRRVRQHRARTWRPRHRLNGTRVSSRWKG